MGKAGATVPERQLSALLLLGMLTTPPIFVWWFLRKGYRRSLRRAAFTYAIVGTVVVLIGRIDQWRGEAGL